MKLGSIPSKTRWTVLSYLYVFISPSSPATPIPCSIAQAGLLSTAFTSFLADSTNNLQADPAQQMVYYQQQKVALLAQISNQVSSIAPQVSIPSTLPPPYPTFSPNPSNVRVNVFWFMSLVFCLFAALLAALVQQWVRDYMHVLQRNSNPLKSARRNGASVGRIEAHNWMRDPLRVTRYCAVCGGREGIGGGSQQFRE